MPLGGRKNAIQLPQGKHVTVNKARKRTTAISLLLSHKPYPPHPPSRTEETASSLKKGIVKEMLCRLIIFYLLLM